MKIDRLKHLFGVGKKILQKKFVITEGFSYCQDGLYTIHNNSFMSDPAFIKAEQAGAATGTWSNIHWRVHTILWAASKAMKLEGDFVECGTYKGGFAKAIVEYLNFGSSSKTFYLLDTFRGLVPELLTAEEKGLVRKNYEDCFDIVSKTFSEYDNVKLVRGIVPDTLSQVPSDKISFLSIDMNSVKPEIEAIDYFWPKLVPGGLVVYDDYAFKGFELQYKAHNEWAKSKGIEILSLPTGQGLLIK
jgi:hypothetical protein